MSILQRNNVTISGGSGRTMIFIHGYGCDQNMWRKVAPRFADNHNIVLYDILGCGRSDVDAYDHRKYDTLHGHAADLLAICARLDVSDAIVVAHSVGAMIAVLAAIEEPDRISSLALIGPSPCYINDGAYVGGFTRKDIDDLLEFQDANYLGWSQRLAPAFMGTPDHPEFGEELANSFCQTNPEIAKHFAKVTFLSDHRADVKKVTQRSLILQCASDIVAPVSVGAWLHDHMPSSEIVFMRATGHCPHVSAPEETAGAIEAFIS